MKKNFILMLCAVSLLWLGTAQADLLIDNGDFEDGLNGWTIKSGQVELKNTADGPFTSAHGMSNNYALLSRGDGIGLTRFYQDFDILGLSSINVSFNWAFDFNDGEGVKDVFLSKIMNFDTKEVDIRLVRKTTNNNGTLPLHNFFSDTISLAGFDSPTARLRFSLTDDLNVQSWAGIDNVRVSVPEPSAMLLFGTGFVGLVALCRRKGSK